jgi:hypothetical protein
LCKITRDDNGFAQAVALENCSPAWQILRAAQRLDLNLVSNSLRVSEYETMQVAMSEFIVFADFRQYGRFRRKY